LQPIYYWWYIYVLFQLKKVDVVEKMAAISSFNFHLSYVLKEGPTLDGEQFPNFKVFDK
jgi:hypothetical protein